MSTRLYLGDAFGWESDAAAKVAICQLRTAKIISTTKCPKAQLIVHDSLAALPHLLKIFGYIPVINFIAGGLAIYNATNDRVCRPHNKRWWICRGVAMICTGPLLIIVDGVKTIYDDHIAAKYIKQNKALIDQFNTSHKHSRAYWPGHPVACARNDGTFWWTN